MSLSEFRIGMNGYIEDARQRADDLKDPYYALDRVMVLYRRLDDEDRRNADVVLSEWILSGDDTKRFIATVLVEKFRIEAAVPALEAFIHQIDLTRVFVTQFDRVRAQSERETAQRVLSELQDGSSPKT